MPLPWCGMCEWYCGLWPVPLAGGMIGFLDTYLGGLKILTFGPCNSGVLVRNHMVSGDTDWTLSLP